MNIQNEYLLNLMLKNKRADGRKLDEYRKIVVEKNPLDFAEGSALVKLGETQVMIGVKMDVGEPFPDTPNEGVLIVNAELSPMASPNFYLGPPGEEAIELARIVDRGIRESKAIDMEKLCIKEGEKVWMVFIDIQILNHDGNLIDACGLAAMVALHHAKMPEYEDEKINYEKRHKKLPVIDKPIPVTVAKIGDKFVVDPTLEEENIMSSRLTFSTKSNGNVCAIQKGGSESLSQEEILEAIDISIKKGKELRNLLD